MFKKTKVEGMTDACEIQAGKDEKAMRLSSNEEEEAKELYEHRLEEVKFPKARKALKHALGEEIEHKEMFDKVLAEHEKKENKRLRS